MDLIVNLLIAQDKSDDVENIKINNYFQLPIEMIENKIEINKNIINDL